MARAVLLLLALAVCFAAAHTARAGERLLLPQIEGWQPLFSHAGSDTEIAEMIPAAETPANWTRRATVQAFRGLHLSVADFLQTVALRSSEVCEALDSDIMRLGTPDGVEAGMRAVACGRYRGGDRGEYILYYALKGQQAFYVVTRAWRGPAFDPRTVPVSAQELDEWKRYLRSARLCDTADSRRPCR